jgi:hypothetical protein
MHILTSQDCISHVSKQITSDVYSMCIDRDFVLGMEHEHNHNFNVVDQHGDFLQRTTLADAMLVHRIKEGLITKHFELTTHTFNVLTAYITKNSTQVNIFPRTYLSKFTDNLIPTIYSETEKTLQSIYNLIKQVFVLNRYKIAAYFRLYLTDNYTVDLKLRTITMTANVILNESINQSMTHAVDVIINRLFSELLNPQFELELKYLADVNIGLYRSFAWGSVLLWILTVLSCLLLFVTFSRSMYQTGLLVNTCKDNCKFYIQRHLSKVHTEDDNKKMGVIQI